MSLQLHEDSRSIDELGRVVIPPIVRTILGLESGNRVIFVVRNGEVHVEKEEAERDASPPTA